MLDLSQLRNGLAVADGGWSTVLVARGYPAARPAELACLTHADMVETLARDYVAAGAVFVSTNTFAANALMGPVRGVEGDLAELNRAAAQLARRAAGGGVASVAGVIGPSGKIVAIQEAPEAELTDCFAQQAAALAAGGADLFVLETYCELAELLVAIKAVRGAARLPIVASLSFDSGPQRTRTVAGNEAADCARALTDAGADMLGCNCGDGIDTALPAVVALRSNTTLPVWVKPSAGLPDLVEGRLAYPQTPDDFDNHVPTLIEAGANVLGGCCGVGPEHIRRVAALVSAHLRRRRRA